MVKCGWWFAVIGKSMGFMSKSERSSQLEMTSSDSLGLSFFFRKRESLVELYGPSSSKGVAHFQVSRKRYSGMTWV